MMRKKQKLEQTKEEAEERRRQADPQVAAPTRGRGVAGSQVDILVEAARSTGSSVAGEAELQLEDSDHQKMRKRQTAEQRAEEAAELRQVDPQVAAAAGRGVAGCQVEEEPPAYQPKQPKVGVSYNPGSNRGRTTEVQEAAKGCFKIISNNCATLAPKIEEIMSWEVDAIALHETRLSNLLQAKLAAKMAKEKWQAFFGKATQAAASSSKVASATNAAKGGVAIITRTQVPAKKAPENADTIILRDQCRWEEVLVALDKGNRHVRIASVYGYDGAPSDAQRFRLNEEHIGRILLRCLECGDTPYVVCGDFNITPQESPTISALITKGHIIDVPTAHGLGAQSTFSADGLPQQGVEGKGRTRIDSILANKAAFALITKCRYRWDLCCSDHVPIEIDIDVNRYGAQIKVANYQPPFPEIKWARAEKAEKEQQRDTAWLKAWNRIASRFNQAEFKHDVEQMHKLWSMAAAETIRVATGTEDDSKYKKAFKRAYAAEPKTQTVQSPADISCSPTTCWQRRLNNLAARLKELLNQQQVAYRYQKEGREVSNRASAQRDKLWSNIVKSAPETEPYTQWLTDEKWVATAMPPTKTLQHMFEVAEKRAKVAASDSEKARKKSAKDKLREDIKKGGALAHKAVKGAQGAKKEYVQPTHTVMTEEGLTSEPQKVQKAFADAWSKRVFNLEREKPDWEKFEAAYGQYIPNVPYTQGCITGEEMLKVVQGMGKTVPGPDGWRIHELKLLGLAAWRQRSRIGAVQMMEGKVPASDTQVSTPMMAKSKGTEVIMDHRGLSIFTILWRIESSAWYRRLQSWQESWLPEGIHGGRAGHECLSSAWPAQARIEEALLAGDDRAAATLDYTKLFDRFDPTFYMKMLKAMGYPTGLAAMQADMYSRLVRHIKVAGTYGEPMRPECGMGQGCSLSSIAANATVAIEFIMLQHRTPNVQKSAFIDDRTLDASDVRQLEQP